MPYQWRRIEAVITGRTRNAFALRGTRVRIPPSPRKKGLLHHAAILFISLYKIYFLNLLPYDMAQIPDKSRRSAQTRSSLAPVLNYHGIKLCAQQSGIHDKIPCQCKGDHDTDQTCPRKRITLFFYLLIHTALLFSLYSFFPYSKKSMQNKPS